jgi:ribosomal subunit interface protein
MDVTITGRGAGITDRFRDHVEEKAAKVEQLAERALVLEVRLCRHDETHGTAGDDRVELTLIGPGPVIRAEAGANDKYAAFDTALDKLMERLRRAKDRRKVHRGQHRPPTMRSVDHRDFRLADIEPADAEVLRRVDAETGSISESARLTSIGRSAQEPPVTTEMLDLSQLSVEQYSELHSDDGADDDEYSPVVIRHKVFASHPMTVDDALYYMELVGHDFYLFMDSESELPSVVYRRKGWDYGVIHLDESADELQEVATAARALRR